MEKEFFFFSCALFKPRHKHTYQKMRIIYEFICLLNAKKSTTTEKSGDSTKNAHAVVVYTQQFRTMEWNKMVFFICFLCTESEMVHLLARLRRRSWEKVTTKTIRLVT